MKKNSLLLLLFTSIFFFSCKKETPTPDPVPVAPKILSVNYRFNNGDLHNGYAYQGQHPDNFNAKLRLIEKDDKVLAEITLYNSIQDRQYVIEAHQIADSTKTPNKTPFIQNPASTIFTKTIIGTGGTVTVFQEIEKTFAQISTDTNYVLIIHDPLQTYSTSLAYRFLVYTSFTVQAAPTTLKSNFFNYSFNTGQVETYFAYSGDHPSNLTGLMHIQELADGNTRISLKLNDTEPNKNYEVRTYDVADSNSTPNNTPYNETSNSNLYNGQVVGNGKSANFNKVSSIGFNELTSNYLGFLVVHDPLVNVNTQDPKTFVIFNSFAR
jgi:hypothetical protein